MAKQWFSEYPQQIRFSTERSDLVYLQVPGCYAVHNPPANLPRSRILLLLNEGARAAVRGDPDEYLGEPALMLLSPVYALQPDGPLAIPSGLVFIRFSEGITVDSRREDILQAGYEVDRVLAYAPQAAWLRAQSGAIAECLRAVDRLEQIPGVENVEPQMLKESVRRNQ